MDWCLALLTISFIIFAFIIIVVSFHSSRDDVYNRILRKLHTIGVPPDAGPVRRSLAILRSITSMQETMRKGYQKYSKSSQPFVLPTMWTGGGLVVLPPSMLHLLNKPRDELSSFNALLDNAQFQYLMTDRDVWANTIHFDIVRKNLAAKDMHALDPIMNEEWEAAFQEHWGVTKEGLVVNAWGSMVRIIANVALRIMVGLPGCRNQEYREQSRLYANAVLVDACFINCFPPIARPIIGPLFAMRARYYQRRLLKILVPLVEDRMRQYRKGELPEGPVSAACMHVHHDIFLSAGSDSPSTGRCNPMVDCRG